MSPELQYAVCPACQGTGVLADQNGALSCLTCGGVGSWLQSAEGKKLQISFTAFEDPKALTTFQYGTWANYGITGVSLALLITSTSYLISHYGLHATTC